MQGRTICKGRTSIHLHQGLSEFSVLTLPTLKIVFIEPRLVLFDVLQPTVQLRENVIQSLDEICPMMSHLNPAKIFPNYGAHLVKPTGAESIPLRPDEKQVRLESFDVVRRPDCLDN